MFAYLTKDIFAITSLYLIEDCDSECCAGYASGGSGADEYLFNSKTISDDASSTSGDEEMPPPFATLPPLFSYC
jgi:hypothetical protein